MTRPALLDFEGLSADYARFHLHPMNRLCHSFGIPLIMLAVVRWTQAPATGFFPWAALVLPLYYAWSVPLAVAMTGVLGAMALLAPQLSAAAVFGAFLLGSLLQYIGHSVYEGKSPAFTKNLVHLLVGPMWILKKLLRASEECPSS